MLLLLLQGKADPGIEDEDPMEKAAKAVSAGKDKAKAAAADGKAAVENAASSYTAPPAPPASKNDNPFAI